MIYFYPAIDSFGDSLKTTNLETSIEQANILEVNDL
jgi:hypothetical protein